MPHWVTTRFDDSLIDPAHAFGSVRLPDKPDLEFMSLPVWHCRYCAISFETSAQCHQHEHTNHRPAYVPLIRIAGRVMNSATETFFHPIARDTIEVLDAQVIKLNGQTLTKQQLIEALTSQSPAQFLIQLSNQNIERKYHISLEFMDENALRQIDLAFIQNDWNQSLDSAIDKFEERTKPFTGAVQYRDALIKYLVALKLKNTGNPTNLTHFNDKFDSVYATLIQLPRPLAVAVLQVIRFSQNHLVSSQFFRIPATFYPMVQFFYGKAHESAVTELSKHEFALPIDQASKELMELYQEWPKLTTEALIEKKAQLTWLRTDSDKRKYDYLLFRKALVEQKHRISEGFKRLFPNERFV